jgi:hypothetical protein
MATGGPVSYTVTGVSPDTQFTGAATPVTGKRVAFSTTTGYEGAVFVPDGVFGDIAAVKQLIEGEVKKVAAAQVIAGTVTGS